MTDQALQIIARGPRAQAEAAAAAVDADLRLEGVTYSILEEDEARDIWRIDAFPTSHDEAEAFEEALKGFAAMKVAREALADADWLAMALSGLPPVRAGRFFIYGVHDRGRVPCNTVNLRIEAGAAFGTGHHGTTVGCLLAYDQLLKARQYYRVLDVGAGTGVLAIAAARTGSRKAVGTDIDRVSVRISRERRAAVIISATPIALGSIADRAGIPIPSCLNSCSTVLEHERTGHCMKRDAIRIAQNRNRASQLRGGGLPAQALTERTPALCAAAATMRCGIPKQWRRTASGFLCAICLRAHRH